MPTTDLGSPAGPGGDHGRPAGGADDPGAVSRSTPRTTTPSTSPSPTTSPASRGRCPGTRRRPGTPSPAADATATCSTGCPAGARWRPNAARSSCCPSVPTRDLRLISRWMNDPAVAEFWALSGPEEATLRHLDAQLDGDGRSAPCLGVLEGMPMSYWEIYRADLDPLARRYPARPHDTGIHLLSARSADRGHGLGGVLLRAVADQILIRRPACARVVAEPDLRNTASVAAFLSAGFRFAAELDLPGQARGPHDP